MAEVLTVAGATLENLQGAINAAAKLWQSLANRYFSRDAFVNQAKEYDTTELGRLLDYASDGPFGSKLKTMHYSKEGVRVVRLQNIDRLVFNDKDKAFIPFRYYQTDVSRYAVYPGDVLMAGLGDDSIPAGRACIAPDDLGPAINKADCYCMRPSQHLDSRFLVAFLNSSAGLRQSAAFAQGTTRYRLNLGNVKRMSVPIPSKAEQSEIADRLDEVHSTEMRISERYAKQSLLFRMLIDSLLGAS